MSLDASGTVGKSIVFSNWKGINYVRRHAIPSNPEEPTQVAVRAWFRALTRHWYGLSAPNKATWDTLVLGKAMSPFNGYIGYNMARIRNSLGFTNTYPYTGTGTASSAPTTTPTGGTRQVSLSIAKGANPAHFWAISGRGPTGFTPSWANVIYVLEYVSDPMIWVDTPLAAGNYYYRIRGFYTNAAPGTFEAEVTGAAT
jgi:hypothetical protein